jgi:intein/homing endonuclease
MSKTLIITTAQGYNVEVTPEHEIMVLNEYGIEWVKASNLTLGKLLAIQYQQNCFGNDDSIAYKPDNNNDGWLPPGKWTSALAYLIGLAISEGCITNRGLTICNMEKEVIDFTQASPLGLRFRKEDQVKLICSSTRLVSFLSWLGIGPGCTADKKVIPDKLFRCSTNILRWVLRGMFDGDGHSNKRNGCVGYTSISKTLIEQLRVLLLNFGIVTKISVDHRSESKFTVKGRTYVSKKKPAYQLLLSTTDSRKFYEVIGFNVVRKQENIQNLKSERYFMPSIIMKQVRNLITEAEISRTHIDKITSINNRRNGLQIHNMLKHTSITRDMLEILLCVYQEENTLSYTYLFDRLTESYNTRWLPIISIKESKSPTVDITVPATRSFTANGIIVSNSQIARTVILAYIKKENRDRKNSEVFRTHLEHQVIIENSALGRFFLESRELSKYNSEHLKILQALEKLYKEDDRAHEGLISKLVVRTGLSRATVTDFFRILRSRSHEISDSPVNREVISVKSMMEIKNGGRSDSID